MIKINSAYRFIAVILAFLVFATSTGFAVNMHYCDGQLKSVGLFGKGKPCHEMVEATPVENCCSHHQRVKNKDCSMEKKDCCQNKILHFQSDQDQAVQTFDFIVSNHLQQFVIAYVVTFFPNVFSIGRDVAAFALYKPPKLPKDIPVLVQTFLL